jgi:hypothetical protein
MAHMWCQCKHENEGELSHSPQNGNEDERRGSWGQYELRVQVKEGSLDRDDMLSRQDLP